MNLNKLPDKWLDSLSGILLLQKQVNHLGESATQALLKPGKAPTIRNQYLP